MPPVMIYSTFLDFA